MCVSVWDEDIRCFDEILWLLLTVPVRARARARGCILPVTGCQVVIAFCYENISQQSQELYCSDQQMNYLLSFP